MTTTTWATPDDGGRPVTPRGEPDPTLVAAEVLLGGAWPTSIGSDTTARIYLSLVRQTTPSRAVLLAEGFTRAEIDQALVLLQQRGLVSTLGDDVDVPPPDVALPRYADALERQASSSRSAVQGLTHAYRAARAHHEGNPTGVGISVLTSSEDLERARFEVFARARRSLLVFFCPGRGDGQGTLGHAAELALAATAPGPIASVPDRRAVFDAAFLEVDGALQALDGLLDAGVDVRISQRVPCSAVIVDDSALADLTNLDSSGYGSMLIRHRPLVEVVRELGEGLYAAASPLPRGPADDTPRPWLDERDRQIIVLIAAGATDTMIARQVRVSQRTVERRLRCIMDELGATTRFQAGVLAARRGLV